MGVSSLQRYGPGEHGDTKLDLPACACGTLRAKKDAKTFKKACGKRCSKGPQSHLKSWGHSQGLFSLIFTRHKGHHVPREHLSESWMVSFCSLALEVAV